MKKSTEERMTLAKAAYEEAKRKINVSPSPTNGDHLLVATAAAMNSGALGFDAWCTGRKIGGIRKQNLWKCVVERGPDLGDADCVKDPEVWEKALTISEVWK